MENPTPQNDEGASIQDRIEAKLTTGMPDVDKNEISEEIPEPEFDVVDVETPEEGEDGASDEPSVAISDLAQYLGVDENLLDVDEDGKVVLKTKIDGQESLTKLQDAITSYQLKGHLDNKTRAVAEHERAIQAYVSQQQAELQQQYQHAQDLAEAAQTELSRRFQSVDWQTLRVTDPAEYAALYQDFQTQQANISNIVQSASAQRNQYQQQEQQRQQAVLQDLRTRSEQVISEAITEWKNPESRKAIASEVTQAIASDVERFFGPGEVNRVLAEIDAGYYGPLPIIWARKAALYDKMVASKASVENKVRSAPKLVKPGQSTSQGKEQVARTLRDNVKKSGGKRGIAEYLLATGKV